MRRRCVPWVAPMLLVLFATAALAQAPAALKPGPEHERLGYFVGTWTGEITMKEGPLGPGGKMTTTDHCEWFEGKFAVVCRSEGTGPTGPAKGLAIFGYSTEEKVYTYYSVDNSGMAMTTVSRGTLQGDTWTYTDRGEMGGRKFESRVVVKQLSPDVYTFRMEIQGEDGKSNTVFDGKCTRKK